MSRRVDMSLRASLQDMEWTWTQLLWTELVAQPPMVTSTLGPDTAIPSLGAWSERPQGGHHLLTAISCLQHKLPEARSMCPLLRSSRTDRCEGHPLGTAAHLRQGLALAPAAGRAP